MLVTLMVRPSRPVRLSDSNFVIVSPNFSRHLPTVITDTPTWVAMSPSLYFGPSGCISADLTARCLSAFERKSP